VANNIDDQFYDRADEIIHMANRQLGSATRGKVSASCMYATARFNSWVSANGFESGEAMREAKAETIAYFVEQYRSMLDENLTDYIDNFNKYMRPGEA
jgi:hypothetical protein